jgi:hypothetical protein
VEEEMTRRITGVLTILLLAWATASAQSLGDLARKEKERREKVQAAGKKVITNDDTPKYKAGAVTTGPRLESSAGTKDSTNEKGSQSGTSDSKSAQPASDEPVDFEGRPESFWRQTFSDARKKISDLENEGTALTLKVADLQNKFYRESNGFTQQDMQREIQKTFYEQDLNKENLAKAKALLLELEKEARKSGALPGWFSGKPNP